MLSRYLSLVMLIGCGPGWPDVPGARVYAEVPSDPTGTALAWWGPEVESAAGAWADLLGPGCPPPFVYTSSPVDAGNPAHPIRLIALRAWTHGPDVAGEIQDGIGGWIEIKSMAFAGRRIILMHELGHALGLGHRPDDQLDAIMRVHPSASVPNPSELAEARAILGCP